MPDHFGCTSDASPHAFLVAVRRDLAAAAESTCDFRRAAVRRVRHHVGRDGGPPRRVVGTTLTQDVRMLGRASCAMAARRAPVTGVNDPSVGIWAIGDLRRGTSP